MPKQFSSSIHQLHKGFRPEFFKHLSEKLALSLNPRNFRLSERAVYHGRHKDGRSNKQKDLTTSVLALYTRRSMDSGAIHLIGSLACLSPLV